MFKAHPEILATRLNGETASYGIRQNMDIGNPDFLRYAERVIRKIAEHYNHSIIGYQIDNETTSYGAAGPRVQQGFVRYLQDKFATVDRPDGRITRGMERPGGRCAGRRQFHQHARERYL